MSTFVENTRRREPKPLQAHARTRLKAWVRADRRSQGELARLLRRHENWLSRYLSGKFDADIDTLQELAALFGHSLPALLDMPTDPLEAAAIDAFRLLPPADQMMVVALLTALTAAVKERGTKRKATAR